MHKALDINSQSRVSYVEGIAFGPVLKPMLHCWNGKGFSKVGVDWSFYATTMWNRYFGVPFTPEEYKRLMYKVDPKNPKVMPLFRKDCFELIEDELKEVLRRPRTRFPRRPKTTDG